MEKLKVIFAGAGAFGVPTLKALLERHEVVGIYTQPDRPAGRGKKMTATPVGEFAAARGISAVKTEDLNKEVLPGADVLVVIAFGQKISPEVTAWPRLGAINLHASRLPRYRGAAPIHRAIMGGETVTGNSVIRMAPKMDAGAVLGMSSVEIGETETTGELHDRLAEDGVPLVLKVLDELAAGTAVEVEQDHARATLAKKISRETAVLDLGKSAEEVSRQIRGLYPWPGVKGLLLAGDGKEVARFTFGHVRAVEGKGEPGEISEDGRVACGAGAIEVMDLQPEGKGLMTLAAFRNGRKWERGMRVCAPPVGASG